MRYYLDTSFFVAIANIDDKYNKEAIEELKSFKKEQYTQLITSDYVINEFLIILMKTEGIEKAIKWSYKITDGSFCSTHYCTDQIFTSAMKIFQSEGDERKPLTLTDSIVYISYKDLSCDELLTFDKRLKNYKSSS